LRHSFRHPGSTAASFSSTRAAQQHYHQCRGRGCQARRLGQLQAGARPTAPLTLSSPSAAISLSAMRAGSPGLSGGWGSGQAGRRRRGRQRCLPPAGPRQQPRRRGPGPGPAAAAGGLPPRRSRRAPGRPPHRQPAVAAWRQRRAAGRAAPPEGAARCPPPSGWRWLPALQLRGPPAVVPEWGWTAGRQGRQNAGGACGEAQAGWG
jgi:hypothetical protein